MTSVQQRARMPIRQTGADSLRGCFRTLTGTLVALSLRCPVSRRRTVKLALPALLRRLRLGFRTPRPGLKAAALGRGALAIAQELLVGEHPDQDDRAHHREV